MNPKAQSLIPPQKVVAAGISETLQSCAPERYPAIFERWSQVPSIEICLTVNLSHNSKEIMCLESVKLALPQDKAISVRVSHCHCYKK